MVVLCLLDSKCNGCVVLVYLQAYQWENDTAVTEWLLEQHDGTNGNLLNENIRCLQRDHALSQIRG